jgi:hypothetical protein
MWVNNIKMYVRERGWSDIDWIDLVHNKNKWMALVNMVMNHPVPYNVLKFLSSCATGNFSKRAQLHGVTYLVS